MEQRERDDERAAAARRPLPGGLLAELRARGVRLGGEGAEGSGEPGGSSREGPPERKPEGSEDAAAPEEPHLVQLEEGGPIRLDELDAAFETPKRPRLRIAAGAAVVLALGALAIALAVSALQPSSSQPVPLVDPAAEAQSTQGTAPPQPQPAARIMVHVVGAVHAPGVYELPAEARVVDAIEAAGGAAEDADAGALNLARVLRDGERIQVPRIGEEPAPDSGADGEQPQPGSQEAGRPGDGRIDLNTASRQELEQLPRIGPALAGRIVDYREQHGGFTSVDELLQVPGIGESILAELEPLVTV
ncbi:MAG: helix-hairpin-helix domain-containing protein [Pseudoclavibacter sp.]|nr:helix-hairpin-helix domain-containing protein [Pseudoclavibacter sp.]